MSYHLKLVSYHFEAQFENEIEIHFQLDVRDNSRKVKGKFSQLPWPHSKVSVKIAKPAKLAECHSPQRKLWVPKRKNARAREAGDIVLCLCSNTLAVRVLVGARTSKSGQQSKSA